jgi:hypothetical protein
MPAYVAYVHRGVAVYLFGSGRREIELGRHEEVPDFGDTAEEVPLCQDHVRQLKFRGSQQRA